MTGRGNKFLLSKFFSFIIISLQGKKKEKLLISMSGNTLYLRSASGEEKKRITIS